MPDSHKKSPEKFSLFGALFYFNTGSYGTITMKLGAVMFAQYQRPVVRPHV